MPNKDEDSLSQEDVDSLLAAVQEDPAEESHTPLPKQEPQKTSNFNIVRYDPDAYHDFKTPVKLGNLRSQEEHLNDKYITFISREGINETTIPKNMPEGYIHITTDPVLKSYGVRTKDTYVSENLFNINTDEKQDDNFHTLDSFELAKGLIRKIQKRDINSD
ncbi:hypothetical protein GF336_01000 [Candidatus Woesearchaeota archaeon]|nr:hypothetical protein [Candidatus Woesearchaeota archaeon]